MVFMGGGTRLGWRCVHDFVVVVTAGGGEGGATGSMIFVCICGWLSCVCAVRICSLCKLSTSEQV